jgi:hypothetical protein
MSNILQEFVVDLFNQIFGFQKPRTGKLRLTHYALKSMSEHQLDTDTLEDVFRHGEEVKKEMIIRKYTNYYVGITYRFDDAEEQFVIITCWRSNL